MNDEFYTIKGYKTKNNPILSEAMEDYLEMIIRGGKDSVRVNDLAKLLHVRPSSVTNMAQKLRGKEMITYQKYGILKLTPKGKECAQYLIKRHQILINFFCLLNKTEDVLQEVEQIEHYLSESTINNLEKLTKYLQTNLDI